MTAQLKKQCTELYEKLDATEEDEKLQVTLAWAKSLIKNAVKKSEKVKKTKIPGAPSNPNNAFMIYCQEKRAEYKEDHPEATTGEITKMIAAQWNEERDGETDVYEEYTQKLKDSKEAYKAFLEENGIEEEEKPKSDKPKRAPSAYNLFMKEQQPIVKEENPDAKQKEIMQIIGEKWSELSAGEKAEYKAMSDEDAEAKGKGKGKEAKDKGKEAKAKSKSVKEDPKKAKKASAKSDDEKAPKKAKKASAKSDDEEAPKKAKKASAKSDDEEAPKKAKTKKIIIAESDDE